MMLDGTTALPLWRNSDKQKHIGRIMNDSVAVFTTSTSAYVSMISLSSPLKLIRQLRVDLPRMSAYINETRVSSASELFSRLHVHDTRIFPFFQQGVFVPSLTRLHNCIPDFSITDGGEALTVHCAIDVHGWKIDAHKKMCAYEHTESSLKLIGSINISLHVTPHCVFEVYDFESL